MGINSSIAKLWPAYNSIRCIAASINCGTFSTDTGVCASVRFCFAFLKVNERNGDPSTVRRWLSGLDSSQPALSFLNRTVTRVAHWLARGHQAHDEAGPLSWITPTLGSSLSYAVFEKNSFHPPSLPGIAGAVLLRWAPEAKKALWAKTSKHSSGGCR